VRAAGHAGRCWMRAEYPALAAEHRAIGKAGSIGSGCASVIPNAPL
jgi:hypothetical protein